MDHDPRLDIRALTEDDLPEAVRLIERANWNQTRQDWLRLIRLEPEGCFAARHRHRLVATVTTTVYGPGLAWIGMMFVDPEYRRRGIATALMNTALGYLRARGVVTVKLDATAAGRPVYESLGFVREGLIERWVAEARAVDTSGLRVLDSNMRPALQALDRDAFLADRTSLLDLLLRDCCVPPLVSAGPNGQLRGYALARRGRAACYVGPVVATDGRTALLLLDGVIGQLAGERLYLDYHTGSGIDSFALRERGFAKQRDLVRMRSGPESDAGVSKMVVAIAGPEVG